MRLPLLASFGLVAACGGPPPGSVTPGAAPNRDAGGELAAALADTLSPRGRVYRAAEVARPAMTGPGNDMPRWGQGDGCAVLRYVVDAQGRVEPGTVVAAPHSAPGLAQPLARAVMRWRYVPAEQPAGRRVRQIVELTAVKRGNGTTLALATDGVGLTCPAP